MLRIGLLLILIGCAPVYAQHGAPRGAASPGQLDLVRIDNSSIWVFRDEHIAYQSTGTLPTFVLQKGEITKNDIPVFRTLLAPYLDPSYLTNHSRPIWYEAAPDEIGRLITVDSPGGNVAAALEIGRMLRKARASVIIGKNMRCLSSCVFLLAGAAHRSIVGSVGIHRPYLESTVPSTFEDLQRRTTALSEDVSKFLKSMNIPASLHDAMRRVPPEQIRILDENEIEEFGLTGDDPVFAELNRQAEARAANLPMSEYLPKKAKIDHCVEDVIIRMNAAGKDVMASAANLKEFTVGRDMCFRQILE